MFGKPEIGKIKKIIEEKLTVTNSPENGDEVVCVRELSTGKIYNAEVGVGKCWKYPGYWDCVGQVYEDTRGKFNEGSIRFEKKPPKSTKVFCGIPSEGFIDNIEKAVIGFSDDDWDGSLDVFIKLLEKYN